MSVITITNKKGGVGKTTTAIALSCICSSLAKKVLLIDVDPQCNSSYALGEEVVNHSKLGFNTLNLLKLENLEENEYLAFITETEFDNLYCLPCDVQLEQYLNEMIKDQETDYSLKFSKAIEAYKSYFDYIFIDTTPFFCLLSEIAIVPSDYIITPLKVDGYSYDGLSYLIERIQEVKEAYKSNTIFKGFFLTCARPTTNDFKALYKLYTENFGSYFLCSFIRQDNTLNSISYSTPEMKETISETKKIKPLTELFLSKTATPRAIHDYKKLLIEIDILDEKDERKLIREIRKEEKEEEKMVERRRKR